jgi:hypothetical protein
VRFYDKALVYTPRNKGELSQLFKELRAGLVFATPIVADDALDLVPDGSVKPVSPQELWQGLAGLRCPFPLTFVEWRNAQNIAIGVLAYEHTPPEDAPPGTERMIIMRGLSSRETSRDVLAWPIGLQVYVTQDGKYIDLDVFFSKNQLVPKAVTDPDFVGDLLTTMHSAAFFMCLSNARNVTLESVTPNVHESKQWKRKTGRDLVTFNRIILPNRVRESMATGEGPGPLELVKGHFKTYTTERPLFGRITGSWWWEPHLRGSAAQGIKLHDYAFGPTAPVGPT